MADIGTERRRLEVLPGRRPAEPVEPAPAPVEPAPAGRARP